MDTLLMTLSELAEERKELMVQLSSEALTKYERAALELRLSDVSHEYRKRTR